jgi:hypothetical protein
MTIQKALRKEQRRAIQLIKMVDINQCAMCETRIHVHVETARDGEREVAVYCPHCLVTISASCNRRYSLSRLIKKCCERLMELALQAKYNNGALALGSEDQ